MLINPFLVSCCSSSTKILFSHSGLINHSNCFSKRWPTYLKLKGLFPQLSHESTNTCYFNYYIHDGVMPISQVSPPRLIFPSICFITKTRFPLAIAIQTLETWSKYSAIQIQSRKSVVIEWQGGQRTTLHIKWEIVQYLLTPGLSMIFWFEHQTRPDGLKYLWPSRRKFESN